MDGDRVGAGLRGGVVVGTVTVSGDSTGATQCFAGAGGAPGSCAAGAFDVSVEALAVGTLDRGAVRARLTGSASSSSAAFTLSGLQPGLLETVVRVDCDEIGLIAQKLLGKIQEAPVTIRIAEQ